MDLLLETKRHVREYLAGLISASELQDWLGETAPDVSETQPAATFIADVWRLLSEYGYGDRSVDSLRQELAQIASPAQTTMRVSEVPWTLVTATLTATLPNVMPASMVGYVPPPSVKTDSQSSAHRPVQVPA